MSSTDKINENSAKGAYFTEAFNQLLVAVNCPTTLHEFLRCLIGYADGKIDVSVFDAELGWRIKPTRSQEAAAKWVQRNRKALREWQLENDSQLVECKSGFKDKDDRPVPSRYYIHLTNYINRILEEAQKDSLRWHKFPHVAIEFAAGNILNEIYTQPRIFKPMVSKPKDIAKDISRRLNLSITNVEAVERLMTKHRDKITKEHGELWDALYLAVDGLRIFFDDEDEDLH
jgi:hypothetical protein